MGQQRSQHQRFNTWSQRFNTHRWRIHGSSWVMLGYQWKSIEIHGKSSRFGWFGIFFACFPWKLTLMKCRIQKCQAFLMASGSQEVRPAKPLIMRNIYILKAVSKGNKSLTLASFQGDLQYLLDLSSSCNLLFQPWSLSELYVQPYRYGHSNHLDITYFRWCICLIRSECNDINYLYPTPSSWFWLPALADAAVAGIIPYPRYCHSSFCSDPNGEKSCVRQWEEKMVGKLYQLGLLGF